MTFTGDKTNQVIQAIVQMFSTALDNLERLMDADPGERAALETANQEIEALRSQLTEVDDSVSSQLITLLQPVLDRTLTLNEKALGATPSEPIESTEPVPTPEVEPIE